MHRRRRRLSLFDRFVYRVLRWRLEPVLRQNPSEGQDLEALYLLTVETRLVLVRGRDRSA